MHCAPQVFPIQYMESVFVHFHSCAEFRRCTIIYFTDPLECTFELVTIFCFNNMAVNEYKHASCPRGVFVG